MSTKLSELANIYFSTINSIANKIQLDINETKLSYEHIWDKLNITDQIDIINETIIKPEISLRYFDQRQSDDDDDYNNKNNIDDNNGCINNDDENINDNNTKNIYMFDGRNLSTYSAMKTGRKILQDDIIGIYRDEHSAPFNVKTKSQLNLNLLRLTTNNNKNLLENKKLIKIRPSSILDNAKDINKIKTHKYKKIINDDDDDKNINHNTTTDDKFLIQFIKNNNQKIINEIETSVAGISNITGGSCGWKKNNDKKEEEEKLVSSTSFGINSSSSTAQSDDDDDEKNYEEVNCLLETTDIRKGYDFLANW